MNPLSTREKESMPISRRSFLWGCAASSVVTSVPVLHAWGAERHAERFRGPAHHILSLNQDWIFEGQLHNTTSHAAGTPVTLPHADTPLSWQNWNPDTWQHLWGFRRQFIVPENMRGLRLFLHFDRVMAGTSPILNGHALPEHLGGFLPFEYEVTDLVKKGSNELSVAVDSRWLQVPPTGSPKGPKGVDYLIPGGINGAVTLRAVPEIYLRDVFARPMDVLNDKRRLDLICQLDAAGKLPAHARLQATLSKNGKEIASTSHPVRVEHPEQEVSLTLHNLGNIRLWHPDNPELYDVEVTLFVDDKPLHRYKTRTGFREARFELDGFFLNGQKLRLFGLNRHEIYPYFGFAASNRTMRQDAIMLRRQLNCNMVRCSHYPQSEAFMDACDELGLMVWEETPGWQYIGGPKFQDLVLRDVREMVIRDRNHPSVIIWGVRINESPNDPPLYKKTRDIALSLDSTRQTSGTMTGQTRRTWKTEWHQDVFAFDDYHTTRPGTVSIAPPLPGVPYLVSEAVGQFNYPAGRGFNLRYQRNGSIEAQQDQALFHAEAHDKAAGYERCSGLVAWCAYDYPSLLNGLNAMKYPGIADIFRLPKLGASYYQSQVDPRVRPVIAPDFYWDFGHQTPQGPGERAAIFSNCERLELFVGGKRHAVLQPDRENFPNTAYPPFFANLKMDGDDRPELEIRGYLDGKMVLSRSFSSDPAHDRLWLMADDAELRGDGSDSTRLAFGVVDRYGAPRAFAGGTVTLKLEGPGTIVGTNPFDLTESGGMAAVWIRTQSGRQGVIRVHASHSSLPSPSPVTLRVVEDA
jgi:beta-galactosidase